MLDIRRNAIIVDVDGTLCDVSSIRHLATPGLQPDGSYFKTLNFDAFHREARHCPPFTWVVDEVERWRREAGTEVCIVTARGQQYESQLKEWLHEHEIPHDRIDMRPLNDYRPDVEVKSEILTVLQAHYYIVHAYDDNPSIVNLWVTNGIPTTVVPGWQE